MIVVGDLNNDRQLDIAVANFGTHNVGVFFGFGNGSFASQIVLSTTSSRPVWIHVCDLNNDKALDIVTANYGTNTVGIFYGYANGSFTSLNTYSTGYDSFPFAVVSGDFNNDEQMDLAVANYGTNSIGILFANGNSTFANQRSFTTGFNSHPYSIVVGYFNNDIMLDIAVTNHGKNNIVVFLGHGDGIFRNEMTYSLETASPYAIDIGDFNNDNQTDLVVTNNGTNNICILLGYGNGTFANPIMYSTGSSSSVSIATGDLNKDNRLDIVIINNDTNTINIMLGYDEFFPIQTIYVTGSFPSSVAVGDFNNDAQLDIVVTNLFGHTVSVFFGYDNGSFTNKTTYRTGFSPQWVAVGDFNNDIRLDIVVTNSIDNTISVFFGSDNGSFANSTTYPTGLYPQWVVVDDFNNDSQLDLIVTNQNDNTVGIFIGYGNGSFANQITYSAGWSPNSVAVGDFNNDIRLDIVVTNSFDDTVSVLIGYGNGSFSNPMTYPTGLYPQWVVVGDFNNDTRLDFVVTNQYSNTLSIFFGFGNGFFANQITISTGFGPNAVTLGDFNNDHQLDIIVSNSASNNVSVFLGYGNGSFAEQTTYSTGSTPMALAVGDFNNDTRLDLAITNYQSGTVSVLLRYDRGALKNDITIVPSIGSLLRSVAVFDYNNDSLLDIFVANYGTDSIGLVLGHGNSTFGNQKMFSTGLYSHPCSIVVHDFNRDGQVDIAVANRGSKRIGLFLGDSDRAFENQDNYGYGLDFAPSIVVAGDFNKDGHSEIVVAYDDIDNVDVLALYETGSFTHPTTYSTRIGPSSVVVGDLNDDKKLDLVAVNGGFSTVSILLGYGNGSFETQTTCSTGNAPNSAVLGYFNNDSQVDIVVTDWLDNTVSVLLGYGNGSFADKMTYSTGSGPASIAAGDFNNDIQLDIVVTNSFDNTIGIMLGYGNGSFGKQTTYRTGFYPTSVVIGDFNNDAQLDILVANWNENAVSVLLGYGNGSFANQTKYFTRSSPFSVAVSDLNNDTRLDFVVTNQNNNTVSVFLGYGNGSFADQMTYPTDSGPSSVTFGDINKDTRLDLLIANCRSDTVSVLLGYGNGLFANQTTYPIGSYPQSITVGDFNNDSWLDIVTANLNGNNVSVLLGYSNHAFINQLRLITGNGSRPKSLAVGDLNKDGEMDIVVANSGINNVGIFLGYGNGSFAIQRTYSTDSSPWSVVVDDFNNDTILDIIVANKDNDNVVVRRARTTSGCGMKCDWQINGNVRDFHRAVTMNKTTLESLSNELFIDLFELFNAVDLLRAFHGLNTRFNSLLLTYFRNYRVDFRSIFKDDFNIFCQTYLPSIIDRIIYLRLSDDEDTPYQCTHFLSAGFTLGQLNNLRSLTFNCVSSDPKINQYFFSDLYCLHHLTHLKFVDCRLFHIYADDFQCIIDQIWHLPKLTHCYWECSFKNESHFCIPTVISTSLQYLTILKNNWYSDELNDLLEKTPCLRKFSVSLESYDKDDRLPIDNFILSSLNLAVEKLVLSQVRSQRMMINLLQLLSNVSHLKVEIWYINLDGHRWKEIIINYLPKLKVLQLKMNIHLSRSIDDQSNEEKVDQYIDTYRTSFWIEDHQWFIRCYWGLALKNLSIYLYSLPYEFDDFPLFDNDLNYKTKTTCPDEMYFFHDSICNIGYESTLFNDETWSCLQLTNIRILSLELSIDYRFLSMIPKFEHLWSLNVVIPTDIYQSQLQALLDRAPHLYSLSFNLWATSTMPPYQYTSTSIHRLNLRGVDQYRRQHCYNSEQCMELSRSPLAIQCRVLIIKVEQLKCIVELINFMNNLRTLDVVYEHDTHSNRYDLVELLRKHLPSTWAVTRLRYGNFIIQS
ncbi:unnamed protein product [Rotaria sordida]|uniref:Uncharacterized protein n=1 Tax=Rotaria sordida TaxID=392033 RepID=A0A814JG35_9BILA|nr:unnamed protein product [Rotaria sordida]CAF3763106.1 unnamed protein product [Rotaria sordida]